MTIRGDWSYVGQFFFYAAHFFIEELRKIKYGCDSLAFIYILYFFNFFRKTIQYLFNKMPRGKTEETEKKWKTIFLFHGRITFIKKCSALSSFTGNE
jgi:hypothetical protein